MSARAIGKAVVSFGLIAIPIKLFSSTESGATISFKQIDSVTKAPVKQKLVSSKDGSEVSRDNIIKGYEVGKDQYLLFSEEEIESAQVAATKSIDIHEFVALTDIDPIYYDKAYYIAPDMGGAKPYWLLHQALKDNGLGAVAQYANRGKQYLVLLRPTKDGIVMQQLHYPAEIRPWSDIEGLDRVATNPAEVALANQLIAASTRPFEGLQYEDTVRNKIQAMIETKLAGGTVTIEKAEDPVPATIDLMAALQQSLALAKPSVAAKDVRTRGHSRTEKK